MDKQTHDEMLKEKHKFILFLKSRGWDIQEDKETHKINGIHEKSPGIKMVFSPNETNKRYMMTFAGSIFNKARTLQEFRANMKD